MAVDLHDSRSLQSREHMGAMLRVKKLTQKIHLLVQPLRPTLKSEKIRLRYVHLRDRCCYGSQLGAAYRAYSGGAFFRKSTRV